MKNLNQISADLFNKIRGRFENVTIGDEKGQVTNVPEDARYFDFAFLADGVDLGKVSIALDEKQGVSVIVGRDLVQGQVESIQDNWFNFLKELRVFAKKRMLNFEVRDINKSNLNKRDYQFLAQNRNGEETMAESRMYGTEKTSFQKVGKAKLSIKHSAPINVESANSRTSKIASIFIESPEGERFKFPYKHLAGARALALHISEGGHAYDDFGKYITSLSEEMHKLRKLNTYMGRSTVMAETLNQYSDILKGRVIEVRKELANLQKPAYYAEAVQNFVAVEAVEVPEEVAENWIDQLTIKQFNEELKDVFPYVYKLVGESTKAEELDFDDIVSETEKQKGVDGKACWDGYKRMGTKMKNGKRVDNCVPIKKESIDDMIEAAANELMGQFAEAVTDCDETCPKSCPDCGGTGDPKKFQAMKANESKYDAHDIMSEDPPIGVDFDMDNLDKVDWSKHSPEEIKRFYATVDNLDFEDGKDISGTGYSGEYAKAVKWLDNNVMNKLDKDTDEGNAYAHAVRKAKMDGKKKGDKVQGPDGDEITLEKEGKTPIGEFILSYFDRENGVFPKGQTAVLTMVEKDYGPQYVEPAAQFIQKVESMVAQRQAEEIASSRYPETDRIKALAGLR